MKKTFKIGTELNETIVQKNFRKIINEILISKTNSINKGPYLFKQFLMIKMKQKMMQ